MPRNIVEVNRDKCIVSKNKDDPKLIRFDYADRLYFFVYASGVGNYCENTD